MSYEEYSDEWKKISKKLLSFPRIPKNVIISTSGISILWQKIQANLNIFLNDLRVKGWETTIMMNVYIDDDKVHLNQKNP